jgi:phage terminase small subunit
MPDGKKNKLSGQENEFCYAYVAMKWNGTKAAKAAGYKGTDNTLGVVAYELLRKPKIRDKIAELTEEYLKDTKKMASDVIKELSVLSFRRMSDYIEINPETRRAQLRTQKEIGLKDAAVNKIEVKQRDLAVDGQVDENTRVLESEIKIWLEPKTKPLELLGKHLGLLNETINHNIESVKEIQVTVVDKESKDESK